MKSLYQDRIFAGFWNKRAGSEGEPYKRYLLDPIMFKLVGNFKNKGVLELGCGNGYLTKAFLKQEPKSITLLDISKYNIAYAKEKSDDKRVSFLLQDATRRWKVASATIDVVYSNMMLNEIKNIRTPIREAFRVLRKKGKFIFSVTHPSWDLYVYAQERAGLRSNKIKNLGNYYQRGYADYIMGADKKNSSGGFKVEHYHRPFSDYFGELVSAGFLIETILEPAPTKKLLKKIPRYSEYKDYPVSLIISCRKI